LLTTKLAQAIGPEEELLLPQAEISKVVAAIKVNRRRITNLPIS